MEELLSLFQKLSGVSFGVLLAFILWASYTNKFQWTARVDERISEIRKPYEDRISELKQDIADWKAIAHGNARAAEQATEKLRTVQP